MAEGRGGRWWRWTPGSKSVLFEGSLQELSLSHVNVDAALPLPRVLLCGEPLPLPPGRGCPGDAMPLAKHKRRADPDHDDTNARRKICRKSAPIDKGSKPKQARVSKAEGDANASQSPGAGGAEGARVDPDVGDSGKRVRSAGG